MRRSGVAQKALIEIIRQKNIFLALAEAEQIGLAVQLDLIGLLVPAPCRVAASGERHFAVVEGFLGLFVALDEHIARDLLALFLNQMRQFHPAGINVYDRQFAEIDRIRHCFFSVIRFHDNPLFIEILSQLKPLFRGLELCPVARICMVCKRITLIIAQSQTVWIVDLEIITRLEVIPADAEFSRFRRFLCIRGQHGTCQQSAARIGEQHICAGGQGQRKAYDSSGVSFHFFHPPQKIIKNRDCFFVRVFSVGGCCCISSLFGIMRQRISSDCTICIFSSNLYTFICVYTIIFLIVCQ